MGIPIIVVQIRDTEYRMFFDTGAQLSYLQDDSLADFPAAGIVTDFFPGVGKFNTDTYEVEIALGSDTFTLRCGRLPGLLGSTLMITGIKGIIGNQLLAERVIGYFPRRNILCI